jgi:hypothetical protein
VPGCFKVRLLPGELCVGVPPEQCCVNDSTNIPAAGVECCCDDNLGVVMQNFRVRHEQEQFGGGLFIHEARQFGVATGTIRSLSYIMRFYLSGDPQHYREQGYSLAPGCGWRNMLPFPWGIAPIPEITVAMPSYFCRPQDAPAGAELVRFGYVRSCDFLLYTAEWRYLIPGTTRHERIIHEFELTRNPVDPSRCGGNCGPRPVGGVIPPPGGGLSVPGGCAGCGEEAGL